MPETFITKAEFARRLQVSKPRVSQMIAMGCPTRGDGLVPFGAALTWVESNISPATRSHKTGLKCEGEGELPALVEARTKLLLVQVQRNQVALEKDSGALVDRKATRRALAAFSRLIRDKWVNFGNRYGQQIAAALGVDPKLVMAELDKAVRLQLDEIANARATLPAGKEEQANA